jgi:mannose-6-phosphate isomerase-like protein (cupin superfamily)
MLRISGIQLAVVTVAGGAVLGLALLVSASQGRVADTQPSTMPSKVATWKDASSHRGSWGEMRTYFRGETFGTENAFAAVAVVEPGQAVHRAHRHAEEEYLIINEGAGVWQLGDKTFDARKGDMLYVEPWIYHGLTNTGDKPLVFTVVKFSSKGVPPPPRPDTGRDEL